MFLIKSEIHIIRNRIILYKDVDDKTKAVIFVIPADIYLLKVNNLVTLEQGVRTN